MMFSGTARIGPSPERPGKSRFVLYGSAARCICCVHSSPAGAGDYASESLAKRYGPRLRVAGGKLRSAWGSSGRTGIPVCGRAAQRLQQRERRRRYAVRRKKRALPPTSRLATNGKPESDAFSGDCCSRGLAKNRCVGRRSDSRTVDRINEARLRCHSASMQGGRRQRIWSMHRHRNCDAPVDFASDRASGEGATKYRGIALLHDDPPAVRLGCA